MKTALLMDGLNSGTRSSCSGYSALRDEQTGTGRAGMAGRQKTRSLVRVGHG